ncbi:unnamed protein product, partial [Staurois parvus]
MDVTPLPQSQSVQNWEHNISFTSTISLTPHARLLGVILNSDLSFQPHIQSLSTNSLSGYFCLVTATPSLSVLHGCYFQSQPSVDCFLLLPIPPPASFLVLQPSLPIPPPASFIVLHPFLPIPPLASVWCPPPLSANPSTSFIHCPPPFLPIA